MIQVNPIMITRNTADLSHRLYSRHMKVIKHYIVCTLLEINWMNICPKLHRLLMDPWAPISSIWLIRPLIRQIVLVKGLKEVHLQNLFKDYSCFWACGGVNSVWCGVKFEGFISIPLHVAYLTFFTLDWSTLLFWCFHMILATIRNSTKLMRMMTTTGAMNAQMKWVSGFRKQLQWYNARILSSPIV